VPVLEFVGVSFQYGRNEPLVLEDVSFTVPYGARVALIGASGSGKSTIGRLVPRLADARAGTVRFNGVDIKQVRTHELRERLAVVSQDVVVFNETIRYNLEYARPGADDNQLVEALKASQLEGVVAALPNGLDTVVGERGLRLSGGERQRLALARAFLRSPELLILDEATSALDVEAERTVLGELDRCQSSVLAITHRLATAREADEILLLQRGCIAERGSHAELVAKGGIYAAMLAASSAEAQADFVRKP